MVRKVGFISSIIGEYKKWHTTKLLDCGQIHDVMPAKHLSVIWLNDDRLFVTQIRLATQSPTIWFIMPFFHFSNLYKDSVWEPVRYAITLGSFLSSCVDYFAFIFEFLDYHWFGVIHVVFSARGWSSWMNISLCTFVRLIQISELLKCDQFCIDRLVYLFI